MLKLVLVLCVCACATDVGNEPDVAANPCRVEKDALGGIISVQGVTVVDWKERPGSPGEYIGFTLDAPSEFVVKADFNFFYASGSSWENPFGTGPLAKSIDFVDFCGER